MNASQPTLSSVWARHAFRLFFAGTTVSAMGTAVSLVALPLLALTAAAVSDAQLGLIRGAQLLPFLFLSIPIGLLADRWPRRRMMIAADLVRLVTAAVIAGLAFGGRLGFPALLTLTAVAGCFTVVYEICYLTVIPDLVEADHLQEANRGIEIAQAGSVIAGPGLGGALVGAITAAGAVLVDAASFAVSAVLLALNRWPETAVAKPVRTAEDAPPAALAGLAYVRRSRLVGPLTAYLGVNNLCLQAFQTALLLLVVQRLRLGPVAVGVIVAAIGVGFLAGAAASPALGRRLGLGRLLALASVIGAAGLATVALIGSPVGAGVGAVLSGMGSGLTNLQSIAIRQSVTPADLLGRVNAVVKVVSYTSMSIGAFLGGWLSSVTDPRAVIGAAAAGSLLATGLLLGRRLRRLQDVPEEEVLLR